MNEGYQEESSQIEKSGYDGSTEQYLTFWIDGQLFGMPIAEVVQIIGVHQIIAVPEYPSYAKGIINLRGKIIPVIDMRLRLRKEEQAYSERTCIIVANIHDAQTGLVVDAVDEVTSIYSDQISITPKITMDYSETFLTGIGKLEQKVILLLDPEKIINVIDLGIA